jgi:hypothetical protein
MRALVQRDLRATREATPAPRLEGAQDGEAVADDTISERERPGRGNVVGRDEGAHVSRQSRGKSCGNGDGR